MAEFVSLRLPMIVATDPKDAVVVIPLSPFESLTAGLRRWWPGGGTIRLPDLPASALWFRVPTRFFKGRRHPRASKQLTVTSRLLVSAMEVTDRDEIATLRDYWAESKLAGDQTAAWAKQLFDVFIRVHEGTQYLHLLGHSVTVTTPHWSPVE